MRAVSLHRDVIVATSRLLQTNCTIVRAAGGVREEAAGGPLHLIEVEPAAPAAETFVVDSPILPDELELLPSLLAQAGFSEPSGLLATHADWDHLLAPLAFPGVPIGCAESTAGRLAAEPGRAQRELRHFDQTFYLSRPRPLGLGAVEGLPVPGLCGIGGQELQLHPAEGHTADGMAIVVPWAGVLIAGDYLSAVEIPTFAGGGSLERYRDTLERLSRLLEDVERVVPGHGPVLAASDAERVLGEDLGYLSELAERGAEATLPAGRRTREQLRLHGENVRLLGLSQGS